MIFPILGHATSLYLRHSEEILPPHRGRCAKWDALKISPPKKKKRRQSYASLILDTTKEKSRKLSSSKYRQSGKYHERAFRGRWGRGRGRGGCVRDMVGRGEVQGKCVRGRLGRVGGKKRFWVGKWGKHLSFIWRGNCRVSWKSWGRSQVEYPCTCTPYHSFFFFVSSLFSTGIKSRCLGGQRKCVRGRGGNVGGEKSCRVRKGGKHLIFIWRGNYWVSCKSWRRMQVEYPCTCTSYHQLLLLISSLLYTGIKSGCRGGQGNVSGEG